MVVFLFVIFNFVFCYIELVFLFVCPNICIDVYIIIFVDSSFFYGCPQLILFI